VHTLGFGSGRTGAGLGRIAEVFGGVADIQGVELGSSPTSGTHSPSSEGVLLLMCVQSLWWRPSDAGFAGCGLAAAVAYSGVWDGGFKSLASGPSTLLWWGFVVPRSGSVGWAGGWPYTYSWSGVAGTT
jgi:hypothetical protein